MKILRLILLVLIISSCSKRIEGDERKIDNLKGDVKSVKETSYEATDSFGKIIKGKKARPSVYESLNGGGDDYYKEFNTLGKKIVETKYFNNIFSGKLDSSSTLWTYADDGRLLLKKDTFPMGSRNYSYLHNSDKKPTERNQTNSRGELVGKKIWEYSENGNMTEIREYDSKGEMSSKIALAYDESDNLTEVVEYDKVGEFTKKLVWEFDENNLLVGEKEYQPRKNSVEQGIIEENELGKIKVKEAILFTSSESFYNDEQICTERHETIYVFGIPLNGGAVKYLFKYDENGNKIEWNHLVPKGYVESDTFKEDYYLRSVTKWDEYGNITTEKLFNLDGSGDIEKEHSFKYKFDNFNNWIERIHYVKNIPKYITIREYEYYN